MLVCMFTGYSYIIQIGIAKCGTVQDMVNELMEGLGSVDQAKGHTNNCG